MLHQKDFWGKWYSIVALKKSAKMSWPKQTSSAVFSQENRYGFVESNHDRREAI